MSNKILSIIRIYGDIVMEYKIIEERINTLVNKVSISLVARNLCNEIVGVCFGIIDFSYQPQN